MQKKNLIIHLPVLHRGYLDFLAQQKDKISTIYIISENLQEELSEFKPDIAAIDEGYAMKIMRAIGFENTDLLSLDNIKKVKGKEIMLVDDEMSRSLYNKYLPGEKVEWASVFLRWDKEKILSTRPLLSVPISKEAFDVKMMMEACKESEKSSEWWRRIGAVLVQNETVIVRGNNKDLPNDHTPYQVGEVRDFFGPGERQDLASTIHAEQNIIATAAKKGISLEGTSLYVTTFPCPVCAKLIALSGIANLFFGEGGSNFDAKIVLDSAGVKITYVPKP